MKLIIYVVGLALMITMAGCEIHEHEHSHHHGGAYGGTYRGYGGTYDNTYRGGTYDNTYRGYGRQVYPYDNDHYYWQHRY